MKDSKLEINPLLCDPETGICKVPDIDTNDTELKAFPNSPKVRIIYFTDPICSSCWGIEAQLRKLKLEYGDYVDVVYKMGGLLPDWKYNSGGISKPSDVAEHWDEVSTYYDMPIDGDLWLEDPLHSSYPPSIAFKAAQLQDNHKAILFMRAIREMVFLHKKNITQWEHLVTAAKNVGLDVNLLKTHYEEKAKILFEEDLQLAKEYGVRGFPTMFFINSSGQKETVYGARPYSIFENALLKIEPEITKNDYDKNWRSLFTQYESLTANEFSELSETHRNESEHILNELVEKELLEKFTTKNGAIWTIKNINS
ncbi:Predicted dithiol-disulfide isomerase, DsbA family [Salegentibacter holothuriorum]|uniref:Predicted dithiol-disulfide isomerase, DsbA family n=1 Tax=Salegentibacter holothuriorum TaxID=241145 RepID=A0A1T5D9B1_9FLAO|nr:ClpXP adapter SpxH family protein [Salegentibacter holothuriorum]SKB68352.1 Predicted dithiol-disulfide isomerase, DsbA family [Salegentibacter holothuriorum]